MFVQAQNDYDLEPSRSLAKELEVGGEARVNVCRVNNNPEVISGPCFLPPGMSLTIVEADLTQGGVFTAILFVDNAPAGEILMRFFVSDASPQGFLGHAVDIIVRISGTSASGAATRPEDIRGGLIHG